MRTSNSNAGFLSYAKGNGIKKKLAKKVMDLLVEYVSHNVANGTDTVFRSLVSFKIEDTTSTLHKGKSFKKVKAYPSKNVLKLSRIKC